MKKWLVGCMAVMLLFTFAWAEGETENEANQFGDAPGILLDSATGQRLYQKDADNEVNVTGLNKLMGVIVVLESVDQGKVGMNDQVTISPNVRSAGGSSAFLEVGESYPVDQLLKAVITVNANDAMIALAEKTHGSAETFVARMNEKAKEMGLTRTTFSDVTGTSNEGQISTASDVAKMAMEVADDERYLPHSKEYMWDLTHPSGRVTQIVNTNRLVRLYDTCDGLMTSSNKSANYCMVATGKKGNMRLLAVVLDAENADKRNSAARSMLEYGFSNFTSKKLFHQGDVVQKEINVEKGNRKVDAIVESNLEVIVEKGKDRNVEKTTAIYEPLEAPVNEGQVIGTAVATLDGKEIGKVNLIAASQVQKLSFSHCFKSMLTQWTGTL